MNACYCIYISFLWVLYCEVRLVVVHTCAILLNGNPLYGCTQSIYSSDDGHPGFFQSFIISKKCFFEGSYICHPSCGQTSLSLGHILRNKIAKP